MRFEIGEDRTASILPIGTISFADEVIVRVSAVLGKPAIKKAATEKFAILDS